MDNMAVCASLTSYPTSIITRIETRASPNPSKSSRLFLPHFHYNKDWNENPKKYKASHGDFLPHFHYNKDWNDEKLHLRGRHENFLPHFHYNKDWNQHYCVNDLNSDTLLTPLPL